MPILVQFKASASDSDIATTIKANGGQEVRNLKQLRIHIINVPAAARDKVLAAFAHHPTVERADAAVPVSKASMPNDPGYPQQWALPKIAWDQAYGAVPVTGTATLAVLDTGVDATHPDLADHVITGTSFVGGDPNTDPNGHGTELAGIAAADVDNATGMAGVAYSGASISSVQVLQSDGTGWDSDVVSGVLWAADNGAKVILMGFSSPTYSAALADAVSYAESKGVVVVAATGNDGSTAVTYPAGLPGVIGVAGTDQNDNLTSFSNTGSAAVAAPGVGIYATQPGGNYGTVDGTSASAAEVAGLAALLVANGDSASQAANQIIGATDPVSGQSFGRIDVANALGAHVAPPATATPVAATPTPAATAPVYTAAALTLSPPSGSAGSNVTVTSSASFITGDTVTIKFDNQVVSTTAPCTVIAKKIDDGSGNGCTFMVPTTAAVTSHTVTATDQHGTSQSQNYTVTSGVPSQLVFGQPPSNTTAGSSIVPAITVKVEDANGLLATSSTALVTMVIATNPGGGTLGGTTSVNAVAGVATFSNLSIDKVGTGYKLSASSPGLTSVTSNAFNVTKATPTITWSNPASIVYGTALSATQLNATASVPGTFAYNPAAGTVLGAGSNQTLSVTFTPTDTTDYSNAAKNVSINVAKAALTVKVNASASYGIDPTTALSGLARTNAWLTYTGFVVGDSASTDVVGTLTCGTTATSSSPVGSYPVTGCSGLTSSNYTISYDSSSSYQVTRGISLSPNLGSVAISVTVAGSGFAASSSITIQFCDANGNNCTTQTTTPSSCQSDLSGNFSCSFTVPSVTAGSYTITARDTSNNSASRTYTANRAISLSPTSGAAGSQVTVNGTGFAANNTNIGITTGSGGNATTVATCSSDALGNIKPGCSFTIPSGTPDGGITVTATDSTSTNSATATFYVTSASITLNPASGTAGSTTSVAVTGSGFTGNKTLIISFDSAAQTTSGNCTTNPSGNLPASNNCSFTVASTATAGSHTVTAVDGGSTKHYGAATFTVNKANTTTALTSSLNPSTYGQMVTFTANVAPSTATGIVNFYDGSTLLATVNLSGGSASYSTSSLTAGSHSITAAYYDGSSFNTSTSPVLQQTVNGSQANQTITFPAIAGHTYGDADFDPGATASSGLAVSYSSTSTPAGICSIVSGKVHITGVGSCTVTADQAGNSNYNPAPSVSQSFNIAKAPLTVTADNQTRQYGAANPSLTATLSGFVNGETLATSGVAGSASCTTTATATSSVAGSPYPITCAQGSLSAGNYSFGPFVAGQLTITRAALTVTAANASRLYGQANPTFTGTIVGIQNSDTITASYSSAALPTSPVGPYAIVPALNDPDGKLANYNVALNNGTLTVGQALLTVTADNQTRQYGAANPTLTATISGFVNGETLATSGVTGSAACTTTATATSSVAGSPYPITCTQGSLASGNYSFSFVAGTLSVTRAPLTVTPADASRLYGDTNPAFTGTIAGIKNSDNITATYSTTATASSPVGSYDITATLSDPSNKLSNYSVTLNKGTLTITKAPLTVTANDATRVYGDPNPDFSVTGVRYSGFQGTDGPSSLGGALTFTTNATQGSPVGSSYYIRPSDLTSSNYDITFTDGTLTVTKAPLTITAADKSKVYGDANPTLTGTIVGIKNGDGISATYSTTATTSTAVGSYDIVPAAVDSSPSTLGNYDVTLVNGTLAVTKAPLTITADNKSKSYGDANPTLTGTIVGLKNNDNITATYSTTATVGTAVGCYTIVPTAVDSTPSTWGNYSVTLVNGKLTIGKATLTVSADPATKTYGDANPTFTASYSGFKNGETLASSGVSGQPSLTTTADTSSSVGAYTITAALGSLAAHNYSFSFVNGTLTITPAALTVTTNAATKVYGQANPPFTVSYSGFVNGDGPSSLGGTLAFDTTATQSSPVGSYDVTPSGLTSSNYTITFVAGTLSVTKAPLTVTANDASKVYGQANPAFSVSYGGFVLGQDQSVLGGSLAFSTPATASSHVGSYSVTPGGLTSSNYAITYKSGTLTITPAALTITADNKTMTYGDTLPALTATYSGLVNGDTPATFGISPNITATLSTVAANSHAGRYTITVSGAADPDYSITFVNGTLTICKAPLTITADDKTKVYGAALPALTASFSGFVNGDSSASLATQPTLSTTATAASHVGSYGITASGAVDADYSISYVDGRLTVTPAPLTITADDKSMIYGGSLPALTWSANFVNGDTASSLTTAPSCSTVPASSPVGTYAISCSGALDPDYTISYVNGSLTINPAALTITANNKTMIYGGTVPSFDAGYSGFVNGDTSSVVSGLTCTSTATSSSPVGTYPITCSGASAANYTITYAAGTLTVVYRFDGFLQPINDTAHTLTCGSPCSVSVFKAGSTVPVKFQIKKADGTVVQANSVPQWLTPAKGSASTASVDENVYADPVTTGGSYRWDSTSQQYIYNWGTSKNQAGYYWRIGVKLDDGQTYYVNIVLR